MNELVSDADDVDIDIFNDLLNIQKKGEESEAGAAVE